MNMCGYHLRCSNYYLKCPECSQQHKDKNKDYLHDVMYSRSEKSETFDADDPAFSQKADTAPCKAVFLRLLSSTGSVPAATYPNSGFLQKSFTDQALIDLIDIERDKKGEMSKKL